MRRFGLVSVILIAGVLATACDSNAPSAPSTTSSGGSPTSAATSGDMDMDPLDGTTWRNTFTCEDVATTLARAGLQKYEKQVLSETGDCEGPMHQTIAFAGGEFTGTGDDGEMIGPTPYQIVNDHMYVSGFWRDTYRVQGNRLIFTDTKIIAALYPYDLSIMPREHALVLAVYTAVPFVRIS
jgi:hypothetical protein